MISDVLAQKITDLWKSVSGVPRYDKPVLQVVIDDNGDPKFVTEAMMGGSVTELLTKGETPTTTSVPFSLASVVILPANANRKPCTHISVTLAASDAEIDQTVVYIAFGATATTASYYEVLENGDSLDITENAYTGAISMICTGSLAGSVKVTEFV